MFVKPPAGWTTTNDETGKLTTGNTITFVELGCAVRHLRRRDRGRRPLHDTVDGQSNRGSAYLFVRPVGGWANKTRDARFVAFGGTFNDYVGWSVAISGNTIAAGAPSVNTDPGGSEQGTVYVFGRPASPAGGRYTQTRSLLAPDRAGDDQLGWSVAMSNPNMIVAGAFGKDIDGKNAQGAAYVFEPVGGWGNSTRPAS